MRKVIKWIGIVLLSIVGIIFLSGLGLYLSTNIRLNKTYNITPKNLSLLEDETTLSKGNHLFTIHCAGCHGDDGGGEVVFHDPMLGTITSANIAGGQGKSGEVLNSEELVRAIRHGVGSNLKPLLVMPSDAFAYLSDEDLGAIITYLQSMTKVDTDLQPTRVLPLGSILISAGAFGDVITAEEIDHEAVRPEIVEPGITAEYGDYLVRTGECRTCHGENLTGGKDPNPDAPPAPNLTRSGELLGWSEEDFINTLRTGVTPGGHQLSDFMPWKYLGQMTDDELKAVWLYLRSLPGIINAQ